MAEMKPSAAPRPNHGVPASTTPTGVTHVRTYQSGQYVVVGNHLAQHRELSLTAIGLATHIMSVPEGTPIDIRSLTERFPEGRDRIASALRELEAHGYLERVREHTAAGRLVTRTYAHHTPAAAQRAAVPAPVPPQVAARPVVPHARAHKRTHGTPVQDTDTSQEDDQAVRQAEAVPDGGPVRDGDPVREGGAVVPTVPRQRSVSRSRPVPGRPRPSTSSRPSTPLPPDGPGAYEQRCDKRYDKAVTLLAGLRRADGRLILSLRDVNALAPGVVDWLDRGVPLVDIHRALVTGLPAEMNHPAGVLAYRLRELRPPRLPAVPERPPGVTTHAEGPRRPHPLQDCDGCERVFRAPAPGRCRDCRTERATVGGALCPA
ncbi:helix-turn-helix domain-containing protein [Streptomyces sp. NPDC056160]|uniref:helix-turn-helix domain-containing protein n=1 Tax=Streptomyces sp. NPDC056160 TaxID=3345731 RepID=UPI0035DEDAB7